jgi:hypothetical protein
MPGGDLPQSYIFFLSSSPPPRRPSADLPASLSGLSSPPRTPKRKLPTTPSSRSPGGKKNRLYQQPEPTDLFNEDASDESDDEPAIKRGSILEPPPPPPEQPPPPLAHLAPHHAHHSCGISSDGVSADPLGTNKNVRDTVPSNSMSDNMASQVGQQGGQFHIHKLDATMKQRTDVRRPVTILSLEVYVHSRNLRYLRLRHHLPHNLTLSLRSPRSRRYVDPRMIPKSGIQGSGSGGKAYSWDPEKDAISAISYVFCRDLGNGDDLEIAKRGAYVVRREGRKEWQTKGMELSYFP